MSDNLALSQVAAAQSQKETTINDKGGEIDAALTEPATIDVTAGNITVADATWRRAIRFKVTGATTPGRTVTLPAIRRLVAIASATANTQSVSLVRGATTLTLEAGRAVVVYTDGTTDGLEEIVGSEFKGFDLGVFYGGGPAAGEKRRVILARAVTFPASLTGSQAKAGTASTGTATFNLLKNGVSIGSVVFTASATGTLSFASAVSFVAGDVLGIDAPNPVDASLADVTITLQATRD